MTTQTDLNDLLNLIKIRIRYVEWKLMIVETSQQINECVEGFLEISRELSCILNLENLSNKDQLTALDYLNIVDNIIDII